MVSDKRGSANQFETATIDYFQNEIRATKIQISAHQADWSTSDLGNSENRLLELKYFVLRGMNISK